MPTKQKFKNIFLLITDGLGAGEEPRSKEFNDIKPNTFSHIAEKVKLEIPTWKRLGIGSIVDLNKLKKPKEQEGYTFLIQELSNAKDTLAGHWEMMGIKTEIPFPVFTEHGFPKELINELSKKCDNRKIIGNKAASGTDIINELAHQEITENSLIVYTSADSVLQICGNEETMGLKNLYRYAEEARRICSNKPEWNVGRIIARPYINKNGKFERTANRHDIAVVPPKKTILDALKQKGIEVIGVGKINDIFVGNGITKAIHSESNNDGMDITIEIAMEKKENTFVFTNLVEFDSHWGHRRNVEGYANALEDFDLKLAKLIRACSEDDLIMVTSDHGNDPTAPGSDHTREYLPVTIYSKKLIKPHKLPNKIGLGTVGNIVARNFDVSIVDTGEDIFDQLI